MADWIIVVDDDISNLKVAGKIQIITETKQSTPKDSKHPITQYL